MINTQYQSLVHLLSDLVKVVMNNYKTSVQFDLSYRKIRKTIRISQNNTDFDATFTQDSIMIITSPTNMTTCYPTSVKQSADKMSSATFTTHSQTTQHLPADPGSSCFTTRDT